MSDRRFKFLPLYVSDWLTDTNVRAMSFEQRGAYVDLLCYQWTEGFLPADPERIRRILGVYQGRVWSRIWKAIEPMFPIVESGVTERSNRRLENELQDAKEISRKRSKAAKARYVEHAIAVQGSTQSQSQSQPQSQSKELTTLARSASPPVFDFEAVYQSYPKKIGKRRGLSRCKTKIKTQAKYEELVKAVANYSAHVAGKDPQFTKHFDSFLSVWEDWINAPEVVPFHSKPPAWREPMAAAAENKREVL